MFMRPTDIAKVGMAAVFVVGLLMAMASSGCAGNDALKNHSFAAEALDDMSESAKKVVMQMRLQAMTTAADEAPAKGLNPRDAVIMAALEFDGLPVIPACNTFIKAKSAYIHAVLIMARSEDPTWSNLLPVLRSALAAYNELLAAVGPGMSPHLPKVPPVIFALLGGGGA